MIRVAGGARRACNLCRQAPERCDSCAWLDDMVQACGFLAKFGAGKTRESFAADFGAVVEAEFHITQHLGMGARLQAVEVRRRYPAVDWAKLDLWATIDSTERMERAARDLPGEEYEAMIFRVTPGELWHFIIEDVPLIEAALTASMAHD
jgi:hypothetical protein